MQVIDAHDTRFDYYFASDMRRAVARLNDALLAKGIDKPTVDLVIDLLAAMFGLEVVR